MTEQAIITEKGAPDVAQRERAAALRRFNRLAVYLPAGLAAALAIGGTIALLIFVLSRGPEHRVTVSAVADALVICGALFLVLACGLFPAVFFAGSLALRRQGKAPIFAVQRLLWRVQRIAGAIAAGAAGFTARLAAPVIAIQARLAFYRTLIDSLKDTLKRR